MKLTAMTRALEENCLRQKMTRRSPPQPFQGVATTMVVTGRMASRAVGRRLLG